MNNYDLLETDNSEYQKFVRSKRIVADPAGFDPSSSLNSALFPWQRDIVSWGLRRGRAAFFEWPGLGKTPQQLEWAHHVSEHAGAPVLLLAPLAVSYQTAREAMKFGIPVTVCRTADDVRDGINITNYEKLHHFKPGNFKGIVLDESSILKSFDGKTRKAITVFARGIPYRLACTATPAPNDITEIINHAEFLDIMSGKEIIALFFRQDGNSSNKFVLKSHARKAFWTWMASWCVAIRRPSDLGYPDDGFILPGIRVHEEIVESVPLDGYLFSMPAKGLLQQRQARRHSLADRVALCADRVNSDKDSWVCWCELNDESTSLARAIPDAVEVTGSDSDDFKEKAMLDFVNGSVRVLVTKGSIAGWGMNWQHCHKAAFVGVGNSFEMKFQETCRIYRFGQKEIVDEYIYSSEAEQGALDNVRRKERQAGEMMEEIVSHMRGLSLGRAGRDDMDVNHNVDMIVPDWMKDDPFCG
jgi:hypothetical protein